MWMRSTLLALWLISAPCFSQPHGDQTLKEEGRALQGLEAQFWNWRMADAPLFSTAVGETRHNGALESYNYTVYQDRKNTVLRYLHSLQDVDREELNDDEKLDYDIFTDYLQTYLDGARWNSYFAMNSVTFLEGINADPGRMQFIMPFSTVQDFKNYLQRLRKLPQQADEKIELLKIAVSTGLTLNNVSVMSVPDQIDGLLRKSVQESEFYQPAFTSKLDALQMAANKKSSFRADAQDAVRNIYQALGRLKTYLQQSYLNASRPTWGIGGLREGEQIYRQCLRYHTSTTMTPQQVHDLGLKEVARIRSNMDAAMKRLNFTGTSREFYDSLSADPRFHKNSSEALLDTYRDYITNQITPKIKTVFTDIPDLPLEVQAMPYDGPGGAYLAGTPDGSVPGIFSVNVWDPEHKMIVGMMALVLHEAIPGHHLQAVYSMTAKIPKYRALIEDDNYYRMPATFPINTAYMEGWALYAEYLGEELGLYTDDYMLMGRYSEEVFRACRLVVDTGLHFMGWSREQAIQYMVDNTAESLASANTEIDRYLTWPGQATAYKIGEITIRQLRQKATDALGSKFQLADFHSLVLKNGGMPLHLLERLVQQWIDQVKAA